jgi:hypothetical protein
MALDDGNEPKRAIHTTVDIWILGAFVFLHSWAGINPPVVTLISLSEDA